MSAASPARPARLPLQQRSRARYERLLDAADHLALHAAITTIGIYDIARQAGVPPASAYHFFPSAESALVALAERYLRLLHEVSDAPLAPEVAAGLSGWSEALRIRAGRITGYFNARPVACKLFLAGDALGAIRQLDIEDSTQAAERVANWLDLYFHLPRIENRFLHFSTLVGLQEGIWRMSTARHGIITPEYAEAAATAAIRYAETFLPPALPVRPPPRMEPQS